MLCPINFEEIIKKGLVIKRSLIARGVIKLYKNKDQDSSFNDKPKLWEMNKNITNDGLVKIIKEDHSNKLSSKQHTKQPTK